MTTVENRHANARKPLSDSGAHSSPPAGHGAWLALAAALLGWMFDGAEMGVFTLIGKPAVIDLLGTAGTGPDAVKLVPTWLGIITGIFLVGAATGGVVFGWLGDRIGRVRAMTLSVLTYAVFTSLCGLAQSPIQLGVMRFIASLGMGGEWSLGVALVMEVWPNRSRAFMAGLIGAAANVGYLMVALVGLSLSAMLGQIESILSSSGLPEWIVTRLVANSGWRIIMILGIVPALLTFMIRLFVPESKKWEEQRDKGSTSHWVTADLLGVVFGCAGPGLMVYLYGMRTFGAEYSTATMVIATIGGIAVALVGFTFPVMRFLQRMRASGQMKDSSEFGTTIRRLLLAACLSGVALLGTWGGTQQASAWADNLAEPLRAEAKEKGVELKIYPREYTLLWLSVGAIIGTLGAAMMGDLFGRRKAYFMLCVASLASVILLFQGNSIYGPKLLVCAFISGTCTASFYGWLPLYLPELFRTSVRTGQGFGFNFGRILAAVGSFQLGGLVAYFKGGWDLGYWKLAPGMATACTLLSTVYFVGMVLIWFAPETRGQPLPD